MRDSVRPLEKRHASAAATLHRLGIQTGFLSSLGQRFLRQLYAAIPSCPSGFGYVWEEPDGNILGFIACAEATGRFYKQALLRCGLPMGLVMLPRAIARPSVVKRAVETLRYPGDAADELPSAEVLSIAVSEEARGQGVGRALMQAALEDFARRNVHRVKVAVDAGNIGANRFYERCGFHLAQTREHHGQPMAIHVQDLRSRASQDAADTHDGLRSACDGA